MVHGGPVLVLRLMLWCLVALEATDMLHGGPKLMLRVMLWCVLALRTCAEGDGMLRGGPVHMLSVVCPDSVNRL